MNQELYVKLFELRENLKNTPIDGRTPSVCTDAALSEIARLEPKNKDELLCVSGLGKSFVEKYGEAFLNVLERNHTKRINENVLCPEVRQTLKNLESRLINVNRRNRLLYMPKLSKNYAFDLFDSEPSAYAKAYNEKVCDFVKRFEDKKRLIICDSNEGAQGEHRLLKLKGLLRETSRTMRESGENSLYVAYPFVIGKLSSEDFAVRAPLALFPVEIVTEKNTVCMKMDTAKDILFNSSLLLTFNKFNNINEPLPDVQLEDVQIFRFFEQVAEFYNSYGLDLIQPLKPDLIPFTEYLSGKFPRFKNGELRIESSMVLGKFSMYSSALQKDFKNIIESDSINELINDLLQRYEDIDIYSDSEAIGEKSIQSPYVEKNFSYINDLNISQETAIFNIQSNNKLVMQGPPGTGKSQTITSMIADFVNRGKNVLMVSQKKAALDVIYSRLGKLSKYALLINDVKNKDYFYEQLFRIFTSKDEAEFNQEEFTIASETIDADLKRLDALGDRLYYDDKYGTEMYKIYEEDTHSSLNRVDVGIYAANVPREVFSFGYPRVINTARMLKNEQLLTSLKTYYDLNKQYNWLLEMPCDLSQLQVTALLKEADGLLDLYVHYRSKRLFARWIAKSAYKKKMKVFVRDKFRVYNKKLVLQFMKDPTELYNGLERYTEFFVAKAKYDNLSKDSRLFFGTCYNLSLALNSPLIEQIAALPQYIAYYFISEFEVDNRDVLTVLDNYGVILRNIAVNFSRKKELSIQRLKAILVGSVKANIFSSKRYGDLYRIIDGKRKWSVPRFVDKFSFELFKGIRIFLMTPEVVSEVLPLETGLFDLLIFDEASQIYIEKGVPSIARAKKVVVAGDHKQLRPSSLGVGRMDYDEDEADFGDSNAALEEESLLDLARFKYPEILLNYHYRSKYEELIAFSNYAFYKGRLNVSPNVDKPDSPPIQVHYLPYGLWQERKNEAEANEVMKLLIYFFNNRRNNESVGIITFNSNQRDLILDKLDELCVQNESFANTYRRECMRTENGEDVGLFVKNIENVQGDERDCIIFSLAYAKGENGKVVRNFGWLNQVGGENRLNVAISRAKKKIDMVTSIRPEELKVDDLTNEGPRILKKYMEYAYCVSGGNTEGARDVLRSFGGYTKENVDEGEQFEREVFERLCREGLAVERNVGIGTYKINLAVKNAQGKYVLGIEFDNSLYNESHLSRERDVHRRRYLESRGWKLFRLWSSNWWRDPNKEINHILRAIKV